MGRIVNKVELAEILDRSERQLTDDQDQGLPILHRGVRGQEHSYDTAAVIDWLIQRALARTGTTRSQVELEILQLDLKKKRAEDAVREGSLVPADQVAPIWNARVLAAATYMQGRSSRMAGILETVHGIQAKRQALQESDHQFLYHLGVHGERLQGALDAFLAKSDPEAVAELFNAMGIASEGGAV
jgi:hypothetical protein